MVADDDPVARRLICEIIAADDVLDLVAVAEHADGAVDLAADHYPDVAVLDWMMPGGGGPEASRTIVEESPGTRIIALTAFDTEQASSEMLGAGAGSVLIKGTPPAEIARTIRFAACR
jgi:DNA-binding NarL/FixJ family response regulator